MDYQKHFISLQDTLFHALSLMDQLDSKLLMVIDEDGKFLSLVSIGDIQRAILKNTSLQEPISTILRKKVMVGHIEDNLSDLKTMILERRLEYLPIIDKEHNIVRVIEWKDVSSDQREKSDSLKDIPVVIMAGGMGTRLRPITNIIPKALVPLGEKPIIQIIIERFINHGCKQFYISVNYKGDMIEDYLNKLGLDVDFHFFTEDHPLGTAGSLSLIKEKINGTFFVSNCDIIIDQDYGEVLEYHRKHSHQMTAIAAMKHVQIHYGIMEVEDDGKLQSIQEKPTFHFRVNAGVYVLEADILDVIPENKFYNINVLMEKVMENGRSVGVFPVSEGAWMDIGVWSEYQKTNELFNQRGL